MRRTIALVALCILLLWAALINADYASAQQVQVTNLLVVDFAFVLVGIVILIAGGILFSSKK